MDPQRLKHVYEKLQLLDERLTHRVRPRASASLVRPDTERLDERLRDLATFTVELKEIVAELILAIASRPPAAGPSGGGTA
ncbi:MAG TPA: hypothetical protein VM617_05465 [Thermoanaerobaculia bacterium]|nr:hypothetical protein [Thermoanaerobaculia bacterium]